MKTKINSKELSKFDLNETHLELLHMIAFEYNIDELKLESKLSDEEVRLKLNALYDKLDVTSTAGLIRAAFENNLLRLW